MPQSDSASIDNTAMALMRLGVLLAGRFTTTTKDVGLLQQLRRDGQLQLSPEFQRNAVWSRPAKAYLIDTILTGNPIPVIYFQRSVSAQTSRVEYTVIDGQQRLNAVFLFLDNRFSLTESDPAQPWYRARWSSLDPHHRESILSYDFVVQELSGYSNESVRDMFRRMNRYVVALNPQERRHANEEGAFKSLVEEIGAWPFWTEYRVVTKNSANRMKNDELVAELLILLSEGPQDKKSSVDLYYESFAEAFDAGADLRARLELILSYIGEAVPKLAENALRRPANLYALVGALNEIFDDSRELPEAAITSTRLEAFMTDLSQDEETRSTIASQYFVAQSRQTDNIRPRLTRIEILKRIILGS